MAKIRDVVYINSKGIAEVKSMEVSLNSLKDIIPNFDDLYKARKFVFFDFGKEREDCLLEVLHLINQIDVMFRYRIGKNFVYTFRDYRNTKVCCVTFEECYSFMLREMAEWVNDRNNNIGASYIMEEKLSDCTAVKTFLVILKDFSEWRSKYSRDDSVDTTMKKYYGILGKDDEGRSSGLSKLLGVTDNMSK